MLRARGYLLALTAALTLTAGAASAQTSAADGRRWEVEGFGGLSLFELPSGGTAALPPAGSPLATSGPTNPSRRVPTWFLGDGAGLLNGVNAEFGVAGRITPLDGALASLGLSGANAPAFGLRLRRRLSNRLDVEVSADVLPGSRELSAELVDAVETARASFQSAFTGLLTSGPFTAVAVTATASMTNRSSRELATTAALRWSVASGRIRPYITLGGGLVHQIGDLPSVTLTGSYRFQILDTPINETDTLRLRYEQGSALVGLVGAGVRGTLSERLGWTLDGRVLLGQQTLTLRLDSEPTVTTGTPAGFIESFTSPAIQFSNNTSTGRESSLSGTPLTGFRAFSTSGLQTRYIVTAGLVIRF